jgi:hypothetical protein
MKVMQAVAAIAGFITPILGFGLCGWFLIFRNRAVVERERSKKENLCIEILVSRLPSRSWNIPLALCGVFCLPHIKQVTSGNQNGQSGFK